MLGYLGGNRFWAVSIGMSPTQLQVTSSNLESSLNGGRWVAPIDYKTFLNHRVRLIMPNGHLRASLASSD